MGYSHRICDGNKICLVTKYSVFPKEEIDGPPMSVV
jgi:hypothetical protein